MILSLRSLLACCIFLLCVTLKMYLSIYLLVPIMLSVCALCVCVCGGVGGGGGGGVHVLSSVYPAYSYKINYNNSS